MCADIFELCHEKNHSVLTTGTPKIMNFPFVPNGKFINLGVPECRQIAVSKDVLPGEATESFLVNGS